MQGISTSNHAQNNIFRVRPHNPQKKYSVVFCFEDKSARINLIDHGFFSFDDFWNLPHHFVDDVNYRRGGWSAVSKLTLNSRDRSHLYFVKRQENQIRYSLRYPLGRLTFEFEAEAIRNAQRDNLPCVDVVCWGVKKSEGSSKAILVTRAIDYMSLQEIAASNPDWKQLLPLLHLTGEKIYRMHAKGVRHGALYPNHIFINSITAQVQLIDFEGSRRYRSNSSAIKADLQQLLKRLTILPDFARQALLKPYFQNHATLMVKLLANVDCN